MFVLDGGQDHVHEHLERWWGIAHSKVHNFGLERAKARFECCFPLISFLDAYIVVSPSYIEFGKYPRIFDLLNQIQNQG